MAAVPRPPQPTSPALNFSFPAPRTSSGLMIWNAVAPATEDVRNDLRDTELLSIGEPRIRNHFIRFQARRTVYRGGGGGGAPQRRAAWKKAKTMRGSIWSSSRTRNRTDESFSPRLPLSSPVSVMYRLT